MIPIFSCFKTEPTRNRIIRRIDRNVFSVSKFEIFGSRDAEIWQKIKEFFVLSRNETRAASNRFHDADAEHDFVVQIW